MVRRKKNEIGKRMMRVVDRQSMWVGNASDKCAGNRTRVQGASRSVIDYVLVENDMKRMVRKVRVEEESGGGDLNHTDHKLVWVELTSEIQKGQGKSSVGVNRWMVGRRVRWKAYRKRLKEKVGMLKGEGEVNERWKGWCDWVKDSLEGVVRRKKMGGPKRDSRSVRRAKKWWSDELEQKRKDKRQCYRRYMESVKEEGVGAEMKRKIAYARYRAAEEKLKGLVRRAKRKEVKKWVMEIERGDAKVMWKKLKKKVQEDDETGWNLGEAGVHFSQLGQETMREKEEGGYDEVWRVEVEKVLKEGEGEASVIRELDKKISKKEVKRSIKLLKGNQGVRFMAPHGHAILRGYGCIE